MLLIKRILIVILCCISCNAYAIRDTDLCKKENACKIHVNNEAIKKRLSVGGWGARLFNHNNELQKKVFLERKDISYITPCRIEQHKSENAICVDMFKKKVKTNVQLVQAMELIELYFKQEAPKKFSTRNDMYWAYVCDGFAYQESNDEFIPCIVYSGTSNNNDDIDNLKIFNYEFQFDDVTESYTDTIINSTFESVCVLMGLTYESSFLSRAVCKCKDTEDFNRMKQNLDVFGYTAGYKNNYGCWLENSAPERNETAKAMSFNYNNFGIDINIFKNLQVRFTADVPLLVERYIKNKLEPNIESLYPTDYEITNGNYPKNLAHTYENLGVKCLSGQNRSHRVYCYMINWKQFAKAGLESLLTDQINKWSLEFPFADTSELGPDMSSGGEMGLRCFVDGGVWNGKSCQPVNKDQCDKIIAKMPGKVHWNNDLKICTINNEGITTSDVEFAAEIIGTVLAVAAIGPATGVLLVLAVAGAAANSVSTLISFMEKHDAKDIYEKSVRCLNNKDKNSKHQCAIDNIALFHKKDFYNWSIDAQEADALDSLLEQLFKAIDKERIPEDSINAARKLILQSRLDDWRNNAKQTLFIVGLVCSLISIEGSVLKMGTKAKVVSPVVSVASPAKLLPKTVNQASGIVNDLFSSVSNAKTIVDSSQ